MADIFVSYKAEDRRRVKRLVEALEADNHSVWWDEQIGGGSAWRHEIEAALNAAKCVVVAWSKHSVGPEGMFVQDEATRAQQRHVYVPVTIDKIHLPLGFGETQALPLVGWHGDRSDRRYQAVLAAVRRIAGDETHLPVTHPIQSSRLSRRTMLAGGAVAAATVAGVGGWFVLRPKGASASNRIAVLPFANLSGDPAQAYFSDGIAEELRSSLSRVGMQVIGRASCDAVRNLDIKTAAAKLGVANILTGSVRRSPQTIRIDAQLVSGSDGVERWSQVYDRPAGDVLKIQTDIAENVAQALSVALGQAGRAALTLGGTKSPSAQDFFLRAVHDPSDSEAGRDRQLALFNAAISLDPNYAYAYAYKAAIVSFKADFAPSVDARRRGLSEAIAVVNQAISIAPGMAFGYSVRFLIETEQLQIARAFADARHAISLPGEDANVFYLYAGALDMVGQLEEALRFRDKAISLDPLNADYNQGRATTLVEMHRYSDAVASARRAVAINPEASDYRRTLREALLLQGNFVEAEAVARSLGPTSQLYYEALVAARAGRRALALDKLRTLQSRDGGANHYGYAGIYAQLGLTEDAFKELQLAWHIQDSGLASMRVDPFLDPIRADPRFAALERKLDFPQSV